jgi:hypothetical protein
MFCLSDLMFSVRKELWINTQIGHLFQCRRLDKEEHAIEGAKIKSKNPHFFKLKLAVLTVFSV